MLDIASQLQDLMAIKSFADAKAQAATTLGEKAQQEKTDADQLGKRAAEALAQAKADGDKAEQLTKQGEADRDRASADLKDGQAAQSEVVQASELYRGAQQAEAFGAPPEVVTWLMTKADEIRADAAKKSGARP